MDALDTLKTIAPGLEDQLSDSKLENYIELASPEVSADYFGSDYVKAVALLAAHKAVQALRSSKFQDVPGAPSGGIEGATDGAASYSGTSFEPENDSEKALATTQFGTRYVELKRKNGGISGFTA